MSLEILEQSRLGIEMLHIMKNKNTNLSKIWFIFDAKRQIVLKFGIICNFLYYKNKDLEHMSS